MNDPIQNNTGELFATFRLCNDRHHSARIPCEWCYTQETSRFGRQAASKPRESPIVKGSIIREGPFYDRRFARAFTQPGGQILRFLGYREAMGKAGAGKEDHNEQIDKKIVPLDFYRLAK
jgi:hypothetical protein